MRASTIAARERIDGSSIVRFDVHQRAQHTLMFVSFFILAATGLPLRYSGWASSGWWMDRLGGIDVTRVVHRYAAWIVVVVCVYHVMYLLAKRPFSTSMLPKRKDIGDFIQDMKHTFRLSKEPPQFDRYSYRNKAAYWLVCAGVIVITSTGFVLMYPTGAAENLGAWAYPLALLIHSDAAVLAVGWMVLVHMYFAHFAKHIFPINKSIFTGKVPVERYREEFPLEYARIMASSGLTAEPAGLDAPGAPRRRLEVEEAASEEE